MNGKLIDVDALLREIARYLAAVDAFRAAACEPTWLPEPAVDAHRRSARGTQEGTRQAHVH